MKKGYLVTLCLIIIFDITLPLVEPRSQEYLLSIYFTIGYICLWIILPPVNRISLTLNLFVLSHFFILFSWISILLYDYYLTIFGYGHIGHWWGMAIHDTHIIFPNLIILMVLSLIMIRHNRRLDKKVFIIFTSWIILSLTLCFIIFISYNYFYSIPLDL